MRIDIKGGNMYGYKVENGEIRIDEHEASVIVGIFNAYISGMSMTNAAKNAGQPFCHSTVKRILQNACYVGDSSHPAIINKNTFSRANAELIKRSSEHKRSSRLKPPPIHTEFAFFEATEIHDTPKEQAEYIYSLIEVIR